MWGDETIRLAGVPIATEHARTLVNLLQRSGSGEDLSTARKIEDGLERGSYSVALSWGSQNAILGVLEDPPEQSLAELAHVLETLKIHRRRQT